MIFDLFRQSAVDKTPSAGVAVRDDAAPHFGTRDVTDTWQVYRGIPRR